MTGYSNVRGKLSLAALLVGVIVLASPLSVASNFSGVHEAKYVRFAASVLIVIFGLVSYNGFRMGRASLALLAFSTFWFVSAIWSDLPQWALVYKGLFFVSVVSGIAFGATTARIQDLRRGLQFISLIAGVFCISVLAIYLRNPTASLLGGRLWMWGLNANLMAQTVAPLTILAVYTIVSGSTTPWKMFGAVVLAAALIILVLTGSRGGFAMALLGSGLVILPHGKRPAVVLLSAGFLILVGYIALEVFVQTDEVRLLADLTRENRSGIWAYAFRRFEESPLIGHGWLHAGASWSSVVGMYPQVLAETGLVGFTLLLISLAMIFMQWLGVRARVRRIPDGPTHLYLAMALIGAPLLHGIGESSTVMGASLNALLLGMGVSILDRLPALLSPSRHWNVVSRRIQADFARQQQLAERPVILAAERPTTVK